jgi:hypothetical protein
LLRSPPASASTAKAGGQSISKRSGGKTVHILAATSRSDAACSILYELFDETIGEKVKVWFPVVYFGHLCHSFAHDYCPLCFKSRAITHGCRISATATLG